MVEFNGNSRTTSETTGKSTVETGIVLGENLDFDELGSMNWDSMYWDRGRELCRTFNMAHHNQY